MLRPCQVFLSRQTITACFASVAHKRMWCIQALIKWSILPGELGEYCWSTQLECTIGESFQQAYVVLPVDVSVVGHQTLEVRATATPATPLHAHSSHSVIPESCGLRYDVTRHFSSEDAATSFCVRVEAVGDVLQCPPFLVTLWKRSRSQSNQEGGG